VIHHQFVSLTSATARANPVGFKPCQGIYVTPANSQPTVAFIATHYNVDFSEHYLGPLLAEAGFGFLGWNTRYRGAEAYFLLEHALIDIAAGVTWLREQGVRTIVMLGNSGGGSLMAAYQSQAVNPSISATWDLTLPDAVTQLPPIDLYISLNAHGGRPEVLTDWMDPSVIDERDPLAVDETLNMYNPDNGPPYHADFILRYREAQRQRNNRITLWVVDEIKRLQGRGIFERVFTMQRVWADLRLMDITIDPSDRVPATCYAGDPRKANFDARGIGNLSTLRSWLSMWSLEFSECSGARHLKEIKVPSLVIQSLADTGVFPSDARQIFDSLASTDKTIHLIEGDHYLTEPGSARQNACGLITSWVHERT